MPLSYYLYIHIQQWYLHKFQSRATNITRWNPTSVWILKNRDEHKTFTNSKKAYLKISQGRFYLLPTKEPFIKEPTRLAWPEAIPTIIISGLQVPHASQKSALWPNTKTRLVWKFGRRSHSNNIFQVFSLFPLHNFKTLNLIIKKMSHKPNSPIFNLWLW